MSEKTAKISQKEESIKDKNLDKVFWFKVILSTVLGILFGTIGLKGFLSVIL